MSLSRVIGFVLLAVGIAVLLFGVNSSQAITEKVVEGVSGRYTDNTMAYIIGGIAMIAGGGLLSLRGAKKDS